MVIAIKVERNFQYRGECVYNITLMTSSSLSEKKSVYYMKIVCMNNSWWKRLNFMGKKYFGEFCVIFWGFATSRREAKKVFSFMHVGEKEHIYGKETSSWGKKQDVCFFGWIFYWRFKEQGLQTILQLSENNKRGKTKQKNEIWGHISGFFKEESSDVQFLSWKRKKIFV